jgi:hypothetical protein
MPGFRRGKSRCLAAIVQRALLIPLMFALTDAVGFGVGFASPQRTRLVEPGRAEARRTCFLDVILHPHAAAIAEATVFIAMLRSDGVLVSQGTGFVVADSATGGTQGLRIVTAAHVVGATDNADDDRHLAVFFSDGMPIGLPQTIARGASREVSVGGLDLVADDISVIEIAAFHDDAARGRFRALEGLPLDGGDDILVGETSQQFAGASWGFSGAAAVNPAGRVVGVLTGADFRNRTTLKLASILDARSSDGAVPRPVTLPGRSLVVVEPLSSKDILHALGRSPKPRPSHASVDVTLAGFPLANCAATSATVTPIDGQAATMTLSQWDAVGTEGAWYLQPQLGTAKYLTAAAAR